MGFATLSRACAALAALAVMATFPAAGYNQEPGKGDKAVVVINIKGQGASSKFGPKDAVVVVGQTVRWHNASTVTHDATQGTPGEDKHLFTTGDIKKGKSSEIVFDQKLFESAGGIPGGQVELHYYCTHHPNMTASIILKSGAK